MGESSFGWDDVKLEGVLAFLCCNIIIEYDLELQRREFSIGGRTLMYFATQGEASRGGLWFHLFRLPRLPKRYFWHKGFCSSRSLVLCQSLLLWSSGNKKVVGLELNLAFVLGANWQSRFSILRFCSGFSRVLFGDFLILLEGNKKNPLAKFVEIWLCFLDFI